MRERPLFAVVLSGCGVFDGTEIHEAVLTMLAIDEAGADYQCFAPNTWQARTIDHFTGHAVAIAGDEDNRNVLAESARIARGEIKDLNELNVDDYDCILFPGGFGAITNWCDFASKGINCDVEPSINSALETAYANQKVIGAMCIAPVTIAKVLGKYGVTVTIGNDEKVAEAIEQMGAKHQNTIVTDACVDANHKVVTTSAYMLAKSIKEVAAGAKAMVEAMVELAK